MHNSSDARHVVRSTSVADSLSVSKLPCRSCAIGPEMQPACLSASYLAGLFAYHLAYMAVS